MSLSSSVCRAVRGLCAALCLALPVAVSAQTNIYAPNGTEYAIVPALPGDQVWPDVAVTTNGGFVVWQDNVTDGSGWGLSAQRVDGTLSGTLSPFRVNAQGTNDQENARVAALKNGGAAFVWQGGLSGYQHIFARFLTSSNTWLTTNDVLASTSGTNVFFYYTTNVTLTIRTNGSKSHPTYTTNTSVTITTNTFGGMSSFQITPALAVLNNSNVIVVWCSYNQAGSGSMLDVYGQIFTPTGQGVGTNFLINQFTAFNQRNPAVAAFKNGGFVVSWVSEQERSQVPSPGPTSASVYGSPVDVPVASIDVYARLYNNSGVATGDEFLVNTDLNPCGSPAVACAPDGSFMVTWYARNPAIATNGMDIYARPFSNTGVGGPVVRVNSYLYGDQYLPHISAIASDYLIVWTSLGEDGSREGVYGRFVHGDGSLVGNEFRVNTTTISQQMQPAVTSDGVSQFLVVWTSYSGTTASFDLFAQRYVNVDWVLLPMAAPFVYAPFNLSNGVYQPQLQVSWPPLLGISVSNYEVYADGNGTPMGLTTNNVWTMTAANGLTANSTHSFQVDYVTADGRVSPISPAASGKTWLGYYWGSAANAIPVEWMTMYFGPNQSQWPLATDDSDGDGMSNYQEFLSGTNPTNAASVLRLQISQAPANPNLVQSPPGFYVSWNTQPGLTYQVQVTSNFATWTNVGTPRFAAGNSDSIFVGGGGMGYYRVLLLRQ